MKYQYNLVLAIIKIDLKDHSSICSYLGINNYYNTSSNIIMRLFDSQELLDIIENYFKTTKGYSIEILNSIPVTVETDDEGLYISEVTNALTSNIKSTIHISDELKRYKNKHSYANSLRSIDKEWENVFDDLI